MDDSPPTPLPGYTAKRSLWERSAPRVAALSKWQKELVKDRSSVMVSFVLAPFISESFAVAGEMPLWFCSRSLDLSGHQNLPPRPLAPPSHCPQLISPLHHKEIPVPSF